jgi:hypothetical protein
LLERRLRPVWDNRLDELDQLARADDPPGLIDLVTIMAEPMACTLTIP